MQSNSLKPSGHRFLNHLLHRGRTPAGDRSDTGSASQPAVAAASAYSGVPSKGKLSDEMIRAAGLFGQAVRGRYDEPGMPAIARGRPDTESRAAQMLFAAVLGGSDGRKGSSRTDGDYLRSLEHRAAEMPGLVKLLARQGEVRRESRGVLADGSYRAATALRLLAQAPSTAPLQTFFLSALLGLPSATAMSVGPVEDRTANDLAIFLNRGFGGERVFDPQIQMEAGKAAVAAALDAGLIAKPLAAAVTAAFEKLVPQKRPLRDVVRPERFEVPGIFRFPSDSQLNRRSRGDGIGWTPRIDRSGARWANENFDPLGENESRTRAPSAVPARPSAVAAAPVPASSRAAHATHWKAVIRDTWSQWTGRTAHRGLDRSSVQPPIIQSDEVRAAIAARVGAAAPATMDHSSRGPATRAPASPLAKSAATGPAVLSSGDGPFIRRAAVPIT